MPRPAKKPTRGGARAGAGRPSTTGRSYGRSVTIRLTPDEDAALTAAAGDASAVGRYLRGAGLVLPAAINALESAGDTLTSEEACGLALGALRKAKP